LHIADRSGQTILSFSEGDTRDPSFAWSLSGDFVVYDASIGNVRDLRVVSLQDGREVARISDVRGGVSSLAWASSRAALVYPTNAGIVVLDLPTANRSLIPSHEIEDSQWWLGQLSWALNDSAIVHSGTISTIVLDLQGKAIMTLPPGVLRLTKDGTSAVIIPAGSTRKPQVVDVVSGSSESVNGGDLLASGPGLQPQIVLSQDEAAFCWGLPLGEQPIYCAGMSGFTATAVDVDSGRLFSKSARTNDLQLSGAFSDSLAKVAYLNREGHLIVSNRDGTQLVDLGEALEFAWQ
jgi:hypothetical protein